MLPIHPGILWIVSRSCLVSLPPRPEGPFGDRRGVVAEGGAPDLAGHGAEGAGLDAAGVDVETDGCDIIGHGAPPPSHVARGHGWCCDRCRPTHEGGARGEAPNVQLISSIFSRRAIKRGRRSALFSSHIQFGFLFDWANSPSYEW